MKRGKYAYILGFIGKICAGKNFLRFLNPTNGAQKLKITISVFLPTLQITALLLKSFCLRLHCYTVL